jgi:hypothetical protein
VGRTVSHAWQGYAARVFLLFGKLKPSDYVHRDGSPGQPQSEFKLTNMESLSDWELSLRGRLIATSSSIGRLRERCLQMLIGRRLRSAEIEEESRSTRLSFTHGLILKTETMRHCRERRPHWLLRTPSGDWPPVVLRGTSSKWQGRNGYEDLD